MPERWSTENEIAIIKHRINKTAIKLIIIKIKEKISDLALKIIVSEDKNEKESNIDIIALQ